MNKQQLKEYIEINHHFMTMQEMCDETGETHARISYICKKNAYKAITIGERILEFLTKNTHLSIDQQATKLGLTKQALLEHYYKNKLPVPEAPEPVQPKPKMSHAVQEFINDTIGTLKRTSIDRKGFTVYNQTGSDLLDEYRGIKTTDRNDKLLL